MRQKNSSGQLEDEHHSAEGEALAKAVVAASSEVKDVTLILGVPFTHLCPVSKAIAGSQVKLAAQDYSAHDKGAYTGEVAASMIAPFGAQYVILGHSERREYHGENSAVLSEKMKQAYANGLAPIYCVGEKLEERESGKHFDVVTKQIEWYSTFLTISSISSWWHTNPYGPSVPVRRLRQIRHRRYTLTYVKCSLLSSG